MENNTLTDEQLAALARDPEALKRLAKEIDNVVKAGEIDYRLLGKSHFSLEDVYKLGDDLELVTAYENLKAAANGGVLEFGIVKDIQDLATAPTHSVDTMAVVCKYFEPDANHELLPPRSPGMDAYCKAAVAESAKRLK